MPPLTAPIAGRTSQGMRRLGANGLLLDRCCAFGCEGASADGDCAVKPARAANGSAGWVEEVWLAEAAWERCTSCCCSSYASCSSPGRNTAHLPL